MVVGVKVKEVGANRDCGLEIPLRWCLYGIDPWTMREAASVILVINIIVVVTDLIKSRGWLPTNIIPNPPRTGLGIHKQTFLHEGSEALTPKLEKLRACCPMFSLSLVQDYLIPCLPQIHEKHDGIHEQPCQSPFQPAVCHQDQRIIPEK